MTSARKAIANNIVPAEFFSASIFIRWNFNEELKTHNRYF